MLQIVDRIACNLNGIVQDGRLWLQHLMHIKIAVLKLERPFDRFHADPLAFMFWIGFIVYETCITEFMRWQSYFS